MTKASAPSDLHDYLLFIFAWRLTGISRSALGRTATVMPSRAKKVSLLMYGFGPSLDMDRETSYNGVRQLSAALWFDFRLVGECNGRYQGIAHDDGSENGRGGYGKAEGA